VGLGNPGPRYADTRHNVGARVVERTAERARLGFDESAFEGRRARGFLDEQEVVLLLPATFMNLSGRAVAAALAELPEILPSRDLLIVIDDADLPLGRLRLRARGGAGGHRGLADVLVALETDDVPRLRFGIGRPLRPMDTAHFVLDRFDAAEAPQVEEAVERAAAAVACFVREGIEAAMNRFNAPPSA
jgi:peptidyl-tRNA hydrolase, PTH1 family